MKHIFDNADTKHSFNCHSVTCLLDNINQRHVSIFTFETKDVEYHAESLHAAAMLWKEDGYKELLNVNRCG